MQPLSNYILVEVEKTHEDTVFLNGKEIYLNPTYNPELNARQHGIVYAVSKNVKNVKVGDKIYCHHFLTTKENRFTFIEDKLIYRIQENMAYAVVRNNKIIMLNNWVFVEQVLEDESKCKTDSGIWVKPDQEDEELHGILKNSNNELIEQGAKINDRIIFSKDSEYVMDIEGEDLMRMRNEDVLAIYNG